LTPAIFDQLFLAQLEYETAAAQRLNNERNIENAKQNYFSTFEAICSGFGLKVVWE
jgi:hypothetical protein